MDTGQAELKVLWRAWIERFSGRRVAAALSFLLVPLIGAVGWIVQGPAVGVTAAAGVFACFVFLVAFAMAHEAATARPAPPREGTVPADADDAVPVVEVRTASTDGEPAARLAS